MRAPFARNFPWPTAQASLRGVARMYRGSALECAACLDVLVARRRLGEPVAVEGKAMLVRIVSMLLKLTERLLGPGAFV